jgi:hypothetical protein
MDTRSPRHERADPVQIRFAPSLGISFSSNKPLTGQPNGSFFELLFQLPAATYQSLASHEYGDLSFAVSINPPKRQSGFYLHRKHWAHTTLGVMAARRGDVAEARVHLRESAAVGSDYRLSSYGPSFLLVRELCTVGEWNSVADYLEACAVFGIPSRCGVGCSSSAKDGALIYSNDRRVATTVQTAKFALRIWPETAHCPKLTIRRKDDA